jgi:hypothetical protein
LFFWDRVSLCSPVWLGTGDLPVFASSVLGLHVCTAIPPVHIWFLADHNWKNPSFIKDLKENQLVFIPLMSPNTYNIEFGLSVFLNLNLCICWFIKVVGRNACNKQHFVCIKKFQ